MTSALNDIPKDMFRVIQSSSKGPKKVEDYDSTERAFAVAAEHNRSLGTDNLLRSPFLVFRSDGRLLFGPANLCPDLI